MGGGNDLALRLNLYNVLNNSTVLGVQPLSGPTFNTVTSIVPPRILEWSLSYTFLTACQLPTSNSQASHRPGVLGVGKWELGVFLWESIRAGSR